MYTCSLICGSSSLAPMIYRVWCVLPGWGVREKGLFRLLKPETVPLFTKLTTSCVQPFVSTFSTPYRDGSQDIASSDYSLSLKDILSHFQ